MTEPGRAQIIDALREVYDPCCADRGITIVDMGVVEDVRVDGSHVDVDLVLTTGWCPFVASMSSAIPDRLRALDGVETVDVAGRLGPGLDDGPPVARRPARSSRMPLEELEPYRERRIAQERGA